MIESIQNRIDKFKSISTVRFYNGTPCFEWTGSLDSSGYGLIRINNRLYKAHRLVAALYLGLDIDDPKMESCHHCDNPACINEKHLFVGNHQSNCIDMVNKSRHGAQLRTHCPKGHLIEGINNLGKRFCKICSNERTKAYQRSVQ